MFCYGLYILYNYTSKNKTNPSSAQPVASLPLLLEPPVFLPTPEPFKQIAWPILFIPPPGFVWLKKKLNITLSLM